MFRAASFSVNPGSNLIQNSEVMPGKGFVDMIWEKDNFTISSEKKHVDIDTLHDMLSRSYWARDRSREDIEKSVENSLCFSLLKDEQQIGFARVLTDTMAYAIILDMIIRENFRGRGLGKWLLECICDHPEVTHLRQVLWTGDADDFYRQGGFDEMSKLKFMARNWKM
jgi:N-acetylglutamate synthase-like GNAT family acetyltransferase